MSVITKPPRVKPFAAIFAGERTSLVEGLMGLSTILGSEPDILSPEFPVSETAYYEEEMGRELLKIYVSWPNLTSPEKLVETKLSAMTWERQHSPGGRRKANLDPGYIFTGGLVLSTGKFRGHRLPLGQGVWGELTLNFHQGQFMAFPWTYLDYQRPDVQIWLMMMRQSYMAALKQRGLESDQ
ncbi:MAG: DUF4416 family protein [Candidatus Adiutrix sp.]|jgi:hypothetical protein|nr:DUF4416 family protein [Candidatus Adiutrix sp.]